MKKLLLGCGILLAIGLGTLGFVVYQLWPDIQHLSERAQLFEARVSTIERENPFDAKAVSELDTERFASYLELRSEARVALMAMVEDVRALGEQTEEEQPGMIEQMRTFLQRIPMVYDAILPLLETHRMSLAEMGWHTQVLWATLENIDSGGGGESAQLDALRGVFPMLRKAYDEADTEDGRPLDELLAAIDASMVSSARRILALDVPRVKEGLLEPEVEAVLMLVSVGSNAKLGSVEVVVQDDAGHGDADNR